MSKIDKIKERINLLKFLLGICVAILLSTGSWLINHIEFFDSYRYFLGIITFTVVLFIALKLYKKIIKLIDILEDL